MKIQIFFLTMSLFILLSACKEDKKDPEPTRTELLVAHSWKIDQVLANGIPVSDETIQSQLGSESSLAQLTRSTITFKTDSSYIAVDEQASTSFSNTWYFLENSNKIKIQASADTYEFTVDELTNEKLNLSTRYTISGTTPTITLQLIP